MSQFWMQVITELKNRGISDILIACVNELEGFPEAIEAVFSQTQVQLCMVHLVSIRSLTSRTRICKAVADDLKMIYQAATLIEAERQLADFEETWIESYPVIGKSWRAN